MKNLTLTKKQRNKIYSLSLKYFKRNIKRSDYENIGGICHCLYNALYDSMGIKMGYVAMSKLLPEFKKYKPKGKGFYEYWWLTDEAGNKKRIILLEKCMKLTNK